MRTVRLSAELEAKIAAWIERQPDPRPSRSEAIRRLIATGLAPDSAGDNQLHMIEHKPFVGDAYLSLPAGQRIAIAGFSHYVDGEPDHCDVTRDVVGDVANGFRAPWTRFFTAIMQAFGETDPGRFWAGKLFFNILPSSVGSSLERFSLGSIEQHAAVEKRFRALLEEYRPDRVIVFTSKGWWLLPKEDAGDPGLPREAVWYHYKYGRTLAYGLRHPQGASAGALR